MEHPAVNRWRRRRRTMLHSFFRRCFEERFHLAAAAAAARHDVPIFLATAAAARPSRVSPNSVHSGNGREKERDDRRDG